MRQRRRTNWVSRVAMLAAVSLATVQCAAGPPDRPTSTTTTTTTTTTTSASTTTTTPVPTTTTPVPATIHPVTAAELGSTWRPGCPVPPDRLRRVELDYVGFDGRRHRGNLVVHQDLVPEVVAIFEDLYRLRFPIERMQTVDRYPGASDELSMRDDNTSAFNCRPLPSGTGWSLHAYGRAIDLNPLLNPFVDRRGTVAPSTAGRYLDRSRPDPGLIHADDPVVRAFLERGWRWGGYWRTPIDYQHFERR